MRTDVLYQMFYQIKIKSSKYLEICKFVGLSFQKVNRNEAILNDA